LGTPSATGQKKALTTQQLRGIGCVEEGHNSQAPFVGIPPGGKKALLKKRAPFNQQVQTKKRSRKEKEERKQPIQKGGWRL